MHVHCRSCRAGCLHSSDCSNPIFSCGPPWATCKQAIQVELYSLLEVEVELVTPGRCMHNYHQHFDQAAYVPHDIGTWQAPSNKSGTPTAG